MKVLVDEHVKPTVILGRKGHCVFRVISQKAPKETVDDMLV